MRIIQTREQKDNLAKYCWDLSKITVAALGIAVGITFAIFGYVLDGMEVSV